MSAPTDAEYRDLLAFRTALLRLQRHSEQRARAAGLTPTQHQLLLAIRGHADGDPTVSDVAGHLMLRHHSVVELVNRAERAGLVRRVRDGRDGRVVRLQLTEHGLDCFASLAASHREELAQLAAMISTLSADGAAATPHGVAPADGRGVAPADPRGVAPADGHGVAPADTRGAPAGSVPPGTAAGRMDGHDPG